MKEGSTVIALDINKLHIDFCLIDKAKKYVIAIGKINTSELQNTRSGKREYFVKKVAHKIKNIAYYFNADVTVGKYIRCLS